MTFSSAALCAGVDEDGKITSSKCGDNFIFLFSWLKIINTVIFRDDKQGLN